MKGLPNFGNTCYFNSALQCLFQVPHLTNYFLQVDATAPESQFVAEYRRVIRQYWSDDRQVIDLRVLLGLFTERFTQFRGDDQQDAHEVVTCMLDMFNQTVIKHIFGGQVKQETMCPSGKSELNEDIFALVLYPPQTGCSVSRALEDHLKYVTVPEYTDAKGKTHHVSVTRTVFTQVPKTLILSFQGRKVITVSEDHSLRVGDAVKTLFALVAHVGDETGGHYVAFTKHSGVWFYKNDMHVSTVESPPEQAYYYLAMYK